MSRPRDILAVRNELGESPIWSPEEQALYWVDWGHNTVHRFSPSLDEHSVFEVGDLALTALARRASGGWVLVAQDGIHLWHPEKGESRPLTGRPDPQKPQIGFNDCAVDRQGRLLVGTFNAKTPEAPDSPLYRVDADGSTHELATGFATVNGLGLSPDGSTLYLTDMRHHIIYACDYDTDPGHLGERNLFARVPEDEGLPDGLIVDAEGHVWSGHWAGWKATRYDPSGSVERQIRFPVEHVISFAFGGDDLNALYVTTAWYGFDEGKRAQQPLAGDLFRVDGAGLNGLLEPAFAG